MRIIIDIDEAGVTTTTIDASGKRTRNGIAATPPPEVLKVAEKLGATSAGAAPRGTAAGAMKRTSAMPEALSRELRAAGVLTHDAGEAPRAAADKRAAPEASKRPGRKRQR